jgi:hypothetical protein
MFKWFKKRKTVKFDPNNLNYPFSSEDKSKRRSCAYVELDDGRVGNGTPVGTSRYTKCNYKQMISEYNKYHDHFIPILAYGSLESSQQLIKLHEELEFDTVIGVHPIRKIEGVRIVTSMRLTGKGYFPYNITLDTDSTEYDLTILLVHPSAIKDNIAPREGCYSNNPSENVYNLVEIQDKYIAEQLPYDKVYTFQENGLNFNGRSSTSEMMLRLNRTKALYKKYKTTENILEYLINNPTERQKFNRSLPKYGKDLVDTVPLGNPVHPDFIMVNHIEDHTTNDY